MRSRLVVCLWYRYGLRLYLRLLRKLLLWLCLKLWYCYNLLTLILLKCRSLRNYLSLLILHRLNRDYWIIRMMSLRLNLGIHHARNCQCYCLRRFLIILGLILKILIRYWQLIYSLLSILLQYNLLSINCL